MKKIDLVQTTILVIALMFAYSGVTSLLGIFAVLSYVYGSASGAVLGGLVEALIFGAACVLLIKKSRYVTLSLIGKEPASDLEDPENLIIERHHLIFAVFVGMGLYTLIESIPFLLLNLFKMFRIKVAPANFTGRQPDTDNVILELLRITLGAFLLYAAPTFTRLIEKHAATRKGRDSQTT